MKTMKKYLKVIICFVAFAVCSFLLAFGPTLTAQAALKYTSSEYNAAINAIKMPTDIVDVSKGQKLTIPLLESHQFNSEYIIRVIDPAGYPHEYTVNKASGTNSEETLNYFDDSVAGEITVKSLTVGTYKIVYILTDGTGDNEVKYYSNIYSVEVKNVELKLDLTTRTGDNAGLINLIPSEVKAGTSIKLPNASVKDIVNETYVQDANVSVTVLKDGKQVTEELTYANGEYTLSTSLGKDNSNSVYVVRYTYGTVEPIEKTIYVSNDFVAQELDMNKPSMPKVELGQKGVELPKPTVSAGDKANVDVNILSVKIQKVDSDIYCELKNNTLKFDFTLANFKNATSYADMIGKYEVTYTVQDAYGKQAVKTFVINDVNVQSKPVIYLAYDYELNSDKNPVDAEKIDTTAATELKSVYGYEEIFVPAAYATDLVSEFKDLQIVRMLVSKQHESRVIYVDNKDENGIKIPDKIDGKDNLSYNFSGDENIGNVNKAVTVKLSSELTESDEFELVYKVVAKNVTTRENFLYSSGTQKYSFKIADEAIVTDFSKPTVTISNVSKDSFIKANTDVEVKVTSTDENKDNTNAIVDKKLKNAVFYYYGDTAIDEATIINAMSTARTSATFKNTCNVLDSAEFVAAMNAYTGFAKAEEKDTKDTFVAKITEATHNKVTIVAISLNDYDQVGIATKTINVKKTEGDTAAPTYTNSNIDFTGSSLRFLADGEDPLEFAQDVDVVLPSVTFDDVVDDYLQTDIFYYVESPETESAGLQYRSPKGKKFPGDKVVGGTIHTSEVGTYVVCYSAMDAAGNVTALYFTFEVYDSSKPALKVEAIGENIKQTGNTITATKGDIVSFDAILEYAKDNSYTYTEDITIEVEENSDNLSYRPSGMGANSYYFNSIGSYTITVKGKVNDGVHADREANVKKLTLVIEAPKVEWKAVENIQTYANTNEDVYLPDITTDYANSTVKVVVKTSTGATINPERQANGQWKFKTNSTSGKYTITYSATFDDAGITISDKVYTLKVGDMTPPTIKMEADIQGKLTQDIVYDGTNQIEYLIDLDKDNYTLNITAKSNGKTIYSYDTKLALTDDQSSKYYIWNDLEVKLTSTDGTVEKGTESGQYFIKGKGKYTITLSTSDRVGNESKDLTIDFKVVTKSETESKNDTVVGAVLIVVSLLVLAGVILFFTFTGKKGGSKKVKKSKTAKSAENVELVVEDKKAEESKEAEDKE